MVQDGIVIAFVLHKLCRGGVSPPDFFTGRETRPLLVGIFHSLRRGNYQLPVMAEQAVAATASP